MAGVPHAGVKKLGQAQVPESDVVAAYGTTAGSLVWPYEHAGDGWWRTRILFASRMGSVICADPSEVAELGWPFACTPSQVGAMTADDRRTVAAWQRYELGRGRSTSSSTRLTARCNASKSAP
jgi:hypothetical protein